MIESRLFSKTWARVSGGKTVAQFVTSFQEVVTPRPVPLPLHAEVIVCGGGLAGLSTAYHLVKHGINDVLVLDHCRIGYGSGSSAVGLLSGHVPWQVPQVQRIAEYTYAFCKELSESFPDIDFGPSRSVYIARSKRSFQECKRVNDYATAKGVDSRIVTAKELHELCSGAALDGVLGGIVMGGDAKISSAGLLAALVNQCERMGIKVQESCGVQSVNVNDANFVSSVNTHHGSIRCRYFVNAAGMWSKGIEIVSRSSSTRTRLPSKPCLLPYMIVDPYDGISASTPTIHDTDTNVYITPIKTENGLKLACGGFDSEASLPVPDNKIPLPEDILAGLPENWELFMPVFAKLIAKFPSLKSAKVDRLISFGDNYTADGYLILGELSRIRNYFVIGGMSGLATSLSVGAGELLAHWIRRGEPLGRVVSRVDVNRFVDLHTNKHYLRERIPEVVSCTYKLIPQINQFNTARNLRASPVYQLQEKAGAVFGEASGYERPLYFIKDQKLAASTTNRPFWFSAVASEYEACRERVGLLDMSSFSKFEVFSPDDEVVKFLQHLCSGNVDVEVGETVYSGMQNEQGGYVTDCTISRLKRNHYFIIAPTIQQVRTKVWMERHLPEKTGIVIQDVTSMFTAMNVIGPASRQLMQDLTDQSMTATDFPHFRCKVINVGFASGIRAVSVTHTGELGWVLYVPNEYAQHVYLQLLEKGSLLGLQLAGYYALRNLRMEKFFVFWGQDIDATTTPFECGRQFRVNFNKGEFIGRNALLEQKQVGVKRRYVQLLLQDHNLDLDPWPQGMEPIYRNGVFIGRTTTAGYGFTLKCQLCLGYIENRNGSGKREIINTDWILDNNASYEVGVAGQRFPAKLNLHSPHLPMMSSEHSVHFRPTQ